MGKKCTIEKGRRYPYLEWSNLDKKKVRRRCQSTEMTLPKDRQTMDVGHSSTWDDSVLEDVQMLNLNGRQMTLHQIKDESRMVVSSWQSCDLSTSREKSTTKHYTRW